MIPKNKKFRKQDPCVRAVNNNRTLLSRVETDIIFHDMPYYSGINTSIL